MSSVSEPPPNKSLGQHWLSDEASLQAICDAARLSADDTVLEIGPGLGSLTVQLVARARQVIAVELDKTLAKELPQRVPAENLIVEQADILRFDLGKLPPGYKVVANLPYYITNHLLKLLSETANPPILAVVLVQEEVAQRVSAKPGQMSLLSTTTQFFWQVSEGIRLPAELFTPPPKVNSQLLILNRRPEVIFPDVDQAAFFRVLKAGFSQRRKTLKNSLSAGLRIQKEGVEDACQKSGISANLRAQSLSLEEWHKLFKALYT